MRAAGCILVTSALVVAAPVEAQEVPADYAGVLDDMTTGESAVSFSTTGDAERPSSLARGLRAAVDRVAK